MATSEKPSPLKVLRKRLDAARKDRAFLKERRRLQNASQMQRRLWENKQKSAERERSISQVLDLPGTWLEKRRAKKRRQEEKRQYAELGTGPQTPKTLPGRINQAARVRFAAMTANRERLWRRVAGALGVAAAALLVSNLVIYSRFTPTRPLVTIGNRVIQRREYQAELDDAAGKAVLTKIVYTELIRQAAAKAGVTPTPAQIDTRMEEMARHGTPLPEGMDPAQIRDSLGLRLALENLRVQGIPASDGEIADFYQKNAALLAQPGSVQSILALTPSEFEAQTATALLAKGATAPEMAAQPDMRVDGQNGFHLNMNAMPDAMRQKLRQTALAMQPGQITTMPLGNAFLTIKCLHKEAPDQPPLSQVREEIALMVKLNKAPSANAELARLYQANRPNFDMERYSAYFADVEHVNPSAPDAGPKTGVP